MANRDGRSVLLFVWRNFINSLKPRQRTGNYVGDDYLGNKYFEIPAQPQIGKRRPERWFVPSGKLSDGYNQEVTAEWEAWLRHRRTEPPTEDELKRNLAIMEAKKINAAKLEQHFNDGTEKAQLPTGSSNFPRYDEYERIVGKPTEEK